MDLVQDFSPFSGRMSVIKVHITQVKRFKNKYLDNIGLDNSGDVMFQEKHKIAMD